MKPSDANDPLDAILKENHPHADDNGFTQRVIASLPPRRRSWLRPAILIGTALIGFGVVAWWLPSLLSIFNTDATGTVNLNTQAFLVLGALLLAMGSLVWGLFAAVEWED